MRTDSSWNNQITSIWRYDWGPFGKSPQSLTNAKQQKLEWQELQHSILTTISEHDTTKHNSFDIR